MTTIWKYKLKPGGVDLMVPDGAEFISVAVDPWGDPCAWAIVEPSLPMTQRRIEIYGTGHAVDAHPATLAFIGTFIQHNDRLVWHAFEAL